MPLRVSNQVERSVKIAPPNVIVLAAGVAKTVLPDLVSNGPPIEGDAIGFEIAARYVFNDTGAALYYAFGTDQCDNVKRYHGKMADQQQLDASNTGAMLTLFSVAGGNVAITIMHRQDLHPQGAPGSLQAIQT